MARLRSLLPLALSVLLALSAVAATAAPTGKPNIVFVITDDQGYGDVAFSALPYAFTWEQLAKAKVDECFYGLGDLRNRPSFMASYPHDFTDDQVNACLNEYSRFCGRERNFPSSS